MSKNNLRLKQLIPVQEKCDIMVLNKSMHSVYLLWELHKDLQRQAVLFAVEWLMEFSCLLLQLLFWVRWCWSYVSLKAKTA